MFYSPFFCPAGRSPEKNTNHHPPPPTQKKAQPAQPCAPSQNMPTIALCFMAHFSSRAQPGKKQTRPNNMWFQQNIHVSLFLPGRAQLGKCKRRKNTVQKSNCIFLANFPGRAQAGKYKRTKKHSSKKDLWFFGAGFHLPSAARKT